jgi:hypothetical protein
LCAAACCYVLLDCRLPCSVLSLTLLSFVANSADFCSLCQSPMIVTWINLLFVVDSKILPCRCNIYWNSVTEYSRAKINNRQEIGRQCNDKAPTTASNKQDRRQPTSQPFTKLLDVAAESQLT